MTVEDLIDLLERLPPTAVVVVSGAVVSGADYSYGEVSLELDGERAPDEFWGV